MSGKSVLIVSPHFPPINAPDHQRVRMALPYLREFGWEPVVLAVAPEYAESVRDDSLLATLPEDVEIHRVRALRSAMTRPIGLGSLALRSLAYLRAKGNEILAKRKFDLVCFSTTLFPVMSLGPSWRKRFSVPYLLDFQDPWLTNYYEDGNRVPPGGKTKFAFSQMLGRALEPRVVREAAHIIVVSPAYPELLRARYPELNGKKFTVLPFAAAERDFEIAGDSDLEHGLFSRDDGFTHWVYAGVAGPIMDRSVRAFFTALRSKLDLDPELSRKLRIHFVGTNYADPSRASKSVEPIAKEFNLNGVVKESTSRLPFLTTLKLLLDADALLVFGSDDPSYTASKLFPYILAKKPLLAIVHEGSSVSDIMNQTRAGSVVTFTNGEEINRIASRICERWPDGSQSLPQTDWREFEQYSARSMTMRLAAVFEAASSN